MQIYNGTLSDIVNKQRNIWLGISTSLKPYNQEQAKQYLEFIINYSKNRALVFIGDEISSINYQELERMSLQNALRKAERIGTKYEERFEQIKKTLSQEEQEKLEIIKWRDVWNEEQNTKYELLKEEYTQNNSFKKEIEAPIIEYLKNRRRTITHKRLETLSNYVLREMPFLLEGIQHQGIHYEVMLYPTYRKSLSEFTTNILTKKEYQYLREKLKIQRTHILIDTYIQE